MGVKAGGVAQTVLLPPIPTCHRQGSFVRVGLYENDGVKLMQREGFVPVFLELPARSSACRACCQVSSPCPTRRQTSLNGHRVLLSPLLPAYACNILFLWR